MRVLRARNVNGLFYDGMHLLDEYGVPEPSRAGPVRVAPWPVMSVYERPTERVLFCEKRDANPGFHLMESLWMLAGRRDSAFLDRYVSTFGSRFGESDGTIHDAYGHRWRSAFGFDQLIEIIRKLRNNSQDRQCVLQMWDCTLEHAAEDIAFGNDDLIAARGQRGRPCNTHVYFRVREEEPTRIFGSSGGPLELDAEIKNRVLDMTILCRSNDAVWGAYGANAVHFSVLMEYVAGLVGVQVGNMYQLSNNWHAYASELERIGPPEHLDSDDPYASGEVQSVPIGTDWNTWDSDLHLFMNWHDSDFADYRDVLDPLLALDNRWFHDVAGRVALSRWQWTHGFKSSARATAEQIAAPDWRRACLEWMDRRTR